MRVLNLGVIEKFQKKHPKSRSCLNTWVKTMQGCEATNQAELKETFNSADYVKGQTVFNVGGNNYRLIVKVIYKIQQALVTHVLTHAEYDRGNWK